MATDYSAIHQPGQAFSRTTSADVTAGQLLYVSGSDTVAKTAGATSAWLGVAAFSAASGSDVTVLTGGVHQLAASGSITAGDLVIAAASGAVQTIGSVTATTASQVVGVALSDAASSLVVVKLAR